MSRSAALIALTTAFTLFTTGAASPATAKMKRVVILETMPVPVVKAHTRYFLEQMALLGYEAGKNLDVQVLDAEGIRI